MTWIDAGDPPVFSVHGSADSLVPYDQALTLHRALERAGVVNELAMLAGRDQAIFRWPEFADVARRMQSFVGRILGSAGVPVT